MPTQETLDFDLKKKITTKEVKTEDKTQAWLKCRQKLFITGTDCLFLLKTICETELKEWLKKTYPKTQNEVFLDFVFRNLNTFNKTLFQYYYEKRMDFESLKKYQEKIQNDKMLEGKERESEIAYKFKESMLETGKAFELHPNGENIAVLEEYNIGATPDYFLTDKDGLKGILECKVKNPLEDFQVKDFAFRNNIQADEDLESTRNLMITITKISYQFQVQLQLLCSNLEWAFLCVGKKKYDTFGSKIEELEFDFIKEDKGLQTIIIECSKRIKKWFEDIENNVIAIPGPDLNNTKDCLICDLLQLNEQASLNWKVFRYCQLMPFAVEFDEIKEGLKFVLECKAGKTYFSDVIQIKEDKYHIINDYTSDTFWDAKSIDKEYEKRTLALKELERIEIGDLKSPARSKKLVVKKIIDNG